MKEVYRIVDANINRVSEGLRVLEDVARFHLDDLSLTEEMKLIRHKVRKTANFLYKDCLKSRDAEQDVGLTISRKNKLDDKKDVNQLIRGNFKRVQEGLRVVEEHLKIEGYYEQSKVYETCRYKSYSIEKKLNEKINNKKRQNPLNTDLYCIVAEEYSNGKSNVEVVRAMIDSGIKIIQYREKDKKTIYKLEECKKIRELTKEAGVTFIVNDDIDIAILVKADGVHIGQEDLPIEQVRKLVGDNMIIGLSTHSPDQAKDALQRGADYIGVGPLYKTYTKKDVCDPVGLEYLEHVVANIPIPFVAIGGIKEHNVHDVISRGAKCVAMVTEIVGAKDIEERIRDIRNKINQSKI